MESEKFNCPVCDKKVTTKEFVGGVCEKCDEEGFWMDPAGGIHYSDPNGDPEDFEDPAKMYE